MTDIVDLLRNGWTTVPQVLAAANEIERLRQQQADDQETMTAVATQLRELRAERDALRDALERIRDSTHKSAAVLRGMADFELQKAKEKP